MNIHHLDVKNYRSYKSYCVDFSPGVNVITGDNGSGKTNLVESIYFASYLKSYRASNDRELIMFDNDFSKILVQCNDKYEIIINKNSKKCLKNDFLVPKQSNFLGDLKVVLFSPETIDLLLKSPSERRKYLDMLICMIDSSYVFVIKEFNHIIRQRNDYLKQLLINNLADLTYLEVLNEKYIEVCSKIYLKRASTVLKLNEYANEIFKSFFDMDFEINYEIQSDLDINNIESTFKFKLEKRYERELFLGTTVTGPSRDDIVFNINGHNVKYFGSKGQQRIVLISLKLAEVKLIHSVFGYYPILILDDVLSELDHSRQKYLFDLLSTMSIQTIITTTDVSDLKLNLEYNNITIEKQ